MIKTRKKVITRVYLSPPFIRLMAKSFGMRSLVCCKVWTNVRNLAASLEARGNGMDWNSFGFRHDDGRE